MLLLLAAALVAASTAHGSMNVNETCHDEFTALTKCKGNTGAAGELGTTYIAGPAASWAGLNCLNGTGAYTLIAKDQWQGALENAKSKCNKDDYCTVLHRGSADGGTWRACRSVTYKSDGSAATMTNSDWSEYSIASDKYKNSLGSAGRLFEETKQALWDEAFTMAFNRMPAFHFFNRTSFKGWEECEKPFANHTECVAFYNATLAKFGVCGPKGIGQPPGVWQQMNCPGSMNQKEAPCIGTFTQASRWHWKNHSSKAKARHYESSVVATAKYADHKSTVDNKIQRFYKVSVKGLASDGTSCTMDYFMRLGTCSRDDCCCKHGLVKYEVHSADHSRSIECQSWFVTAVTAASNFFGMFRLNEAVGVAKKCSTKPACPKHAGALPYAPSDAPIV